MTGGILKRRKAEEIRGNRPLPSSKNPRLQNECKTFLAIISFTCMRIKKIIFILMASRLACLGATRKWPITRHWLIKGWKRGSQENVPWVPETFLARFPVSGKSFCDQREKFFSRLRPTAEDVSAFGQHRTFPPHARKTSGTQGEENEAGTENARHRRREIWIPTPPPPPTTP